MVRLRRKTNLRKWCWSFTHISIARNLLKKKLSSHTVRAAISSEHAPTTMLRSRFKVSGIVNTHLPSPSRSGLSTESETGVERNWSCDSFARSVYVSRSFLARPWHFLTSMFIGCRNNSSEGLGAGVEAMIYIVVPCHENLYYGIRSVSEPLVCRVSISLGKQCKWN